MINEDLHFYRESVRAGATTERLIIEQQVGGLIKFFNKIAPHRSRLELQLMLRFANDIYKRYGVFEIRDRSEKQLRRLEVCFDYISGIF